jgi:pimeloyl-ACP methyl ester carboxylesterase
MRRRVARVLKAAVARGLAISAFISFASLSLAQSPTLREAHLPVPGARLWYVDTGGTGVPVVFLHAATGSSRVWELQIPAVRTAGYRFIAYDRRGYGRTEVDPAGPRASAVDDLEALRRALGIHRFHLVGTAAGGGTALGYALAHAAQLRSVVVANSLGGVQEPAYQELGRRLRPPEFETWPADFRELGPSYRAENPEGTRRWLELEKISRAAGQGRGQGQPQPTPAAGGAPPAGAPAANAITFARLETLRVPVLLLTGDADLYTPPSVLRMFAARIKGSVSVVVAESGHSAYWEQPAVFNRALLEFLRRH